MNAEERLPLDKTSLRRLFDADRIAFHHFDGESTIVGIFERDLRETYRLTIPVRTEFRIHGPNKMEDPHDNASCYALSHDWMNNHVGAFLSQIKPDDEVTLIWIRDNNNGYVTKADLHVDELHARIKRWGPNGKPRHLDFLLDVSICADNSARMIRQRGLYCQS
jgi:hypothetical protein